MATPPIKILDKILHPPIDPYQSGHFTGAITSNSSVSRSAEDSVEHSLYYELSGNREGQPVIFLHGGPGGGTSPMDRRYFDPAKYMIILFDQRGAGKSTPRAALENNTTQLLIKDIEVLREKLDIEKWHVFGGSWGSTLALAYAQAHPDRVKSLVLRGIFTLRRSELRFFYQDGASHLFPEEWERYIAPIPENERGDMIGAYHRRLNSSDDKVSLAAARAWTRWEMATSRLIVSEEDIAKAESDEFAVAFARIENHYFINEGFLREGQLLERQEIDKICHIPTIVVQGRYDVVCPATTAWALKRVWPDTDQFDLQIVPDAGHSSRESGIAKRLVEAANAMVS